MYGFPLTIYLLSGWLQTRYPQIDWLSDDAGHLLETVFGWRLNPHFGPFHLLSFVFIGGGFMLIASGWKVLYERQKKGVLATIGVYAWVRHPQYEGFVLVMFGFLLQWPTLLAAAMFPVLVVMYWKLARREEQEVLAQFGDAYARYRKKRARVLSAAGSQTNLRGHAPVKDTSECAWWPEGLPSGLRGFLLIY